jgi:V8-like Glu-specific endopeptidase
LLTAAHCVAPEGGQEPLVYATNHPSFDHAPNDRWFDAKKLRVHPFYRSEGIGKYDIAAVELKREPPVPVKAWNTEAIESLQYAPIRVVGYGLTNTETNDSGLKRSGMTRIEAIRADLIDFGRSGINRSGTCSGDSGGPSLFTFPDGVERVTGVHSFHSGACGNNTDARVDRFQAKVREWLAEFEGGTCTAGLRCQTEGCAGLDPDCACVEDGQCTTACGFRGTSDPDCPASCVADGVCSRAACTVADPDCQAPGDFCGHAGHCGSRMCITSPQHERPYCSLPCTTHCPNGLECVAGRCRAWAAFVFTARAGVFLTSPARGGETPFLTWCAHCE